MGKLGLRKRLVQGYPENSFSEAIHLLLIDSSLDMLRNRFLSSPQGQRWSSINARWVELCSLGFLDQLSPYSSNPSSIRMNSG
ncbi:hypothetical protein F2Q70_00003598 [Brassica cretica]|uniref:Uncharacterized protein n=1 Tax=Brassica cretica TaxID=69181 RepID=A0A8S9IUS6_BRACR|nr:hypothetical protein F2Q70_00003598 [Brassica cretica]